MQQDDLNYVTPEEAKGKACAVDPQNWSCSGPLCMAWRWRWDYEKDDEYGYIATGWSKTHGRCGMVPS